MPFQQVQVFYLCCFPFLLFNPPFLVSFAVLLRGTLFGQYAV
jgi:hypothetical protein